MDIIVFAIIAIVLAYRLYTVLGREDGSVPQRATSTSSMKPEKAERSVDRLDLQLKRHNIPRFLKPAFSAIILKDPSFDFKDFLQGAEGAYDMILSHAAQGTLDQVKAYLSSKALKQLSAIPQLDRFRLKIADVAIVGAEAPIPQALITVQFKSTLQNEARLEDWVFSKDLGSSEPTWILNEIMTLKT